MSKERNGAWKWIAGILALCVISAASWFATQVWSQQADIVVLQTYIVSIDKSLTGIEDAMREDTIREKQRDSILQDVAFKVNFLFDGR